MGTCKSCSVQQEERDEMRIDGRLGAPTNEPFLRRQSSAVVEVPCGVPVPSSMAPAAAAAADQGSKPSPHSAPQQPAVQLAAPASPPKPHDHSQPCSQPQLPQPPSPLAEKPPALLTGTASPKGVRSPTRNAEVFRLVMAAEKERLAAGDSEKADAITAKVCVATVTTSTYEYAPHVAAIPAKAMPLAAKQASGALAVQSLSIGERSANRAVHEAGELEATGVDGVEADEQEAPARSWAFKPSVGTWLMTPPRPSVGVDLFAAVPDLQEAQEVSTQAAPDAALSKEYLEEEELGKPLAAPDASPSTVCDEVADVESPLPNGEFEGEFCVEAVKAAAGQATPWRFLPSVGTWAMRRPFVETANAATSTAGRHEWARLSWKIEDAAEECDV